MEMIPIILWVVILLHQWQLDSLFTHACPRWIFTAFVFRESLRETKGASFQFAFCLNNAWDSPCVWVVEPLGFWNKFLYFPLGVTFWVLAIDHRHSSLVNGRRKPTKSWWKMRSWRTYGSRNEPPMSLLQSCLFGGWMNDHLGGGFKHFLFSPLPGKMI